jgi:hypothetical protein
MNKKNTLALPAAIFAALLILTGCNQGGPNNNEDEKLGILQEIFSMKGVAKLWNDAQYDFTIKVVNARSDKSQKIYMQPNKSFLKGPDGNSITAGQVVCLNTDYAGQAVTDPSGNIVYTFTSNNASGARIYFSLDEAIPNYSVDHAPNDAQMRNIRFDWVEMTQDGSTNACANLTSLEQVGICMSLKAQKDNDAPIGSLGWNKSFNQLVLSFPAIARQYKENPPYLGGPICRIKGASKWPDDWPADNLNTALKNKSIILTGAFNGVLDGDDRNPAGFRFTGTFDNTDGTSITLTGTFWEKNKKYPATMSIGGLSAASIYSANAASCTISHTGGNYTGDAHATGNTRWSKLFGNLVAGINAGLWAVEQNNLRWTTAKAFQDDTSCNPYSKKIKQSSNSYGDPYSDLLEKVLLSIDERNVNTLVITMLDDDATDGYTAPEPKTHMDPANLQMSLPPPNLLKLTQIDFEQSSSVIGTDLIAASDNGIAAQFPAEIEFGIPVKLIFHFSDFIGSELPYITVTLPVNVFAAPDPATIVFSPKWKATSGLCFWITPNFTGPYVNLGFSGDLKASNYNP